MTLISVLHNLSKSIGCALLLATSKKVMVVYFVGGEILLFLAWKLLRGDFLYWVRVDGVVGVILSFLLRVLAKVIVDFTGCVHFRHPFELGGAAFTTSMVWVSRVFEPFCLK